MPALKGNLHYIHCRASASPFEVSPETTAHKPYNCSSRSCSRPCSVYYWWWARFDCRCRLVQHNDNLKRCARKMRNVHKRQPFSTLATVHVMWTGANKLGPRNPGLEAKIDIQMTPLYPAPANSFMWGSLRLAPKMFEHSDYQERGTVCMSLNYRKMRFWKNGIVN